MITFEQLFDFFHLWHNFWPWPIDYPIRFWSIFVVFLTLNFQGQIWNLLYLSPKWSDCHETKSKHIDWTLGLKCDHRVWPWPWPWPWFFKVKYGICYISAKNGPIATKRKANISIELYASDVTIRFDLGNDLDLWIFKVKCDLDLWPFAKRKAYISIELKASNVTIRFDLGHDLDLDFSRSNMEFAISQPKMVRLPPNEKQTYRLNFTPQMWPSGLTLAMTLIFEFSRSNVT